MERKILDLLAGIDGGSSRLDQQAVREGVLTSREVALVVGAGVAEAARFVANVDTVRSSLLDMAIAWRGAFTTTISMPPPMGALSGVTRALSLLSTMEATGAALRWLGEYDPFWGVLAAQRAAATARWAR